MIRKLQLIVCLMVSTSALAVGVWTPEGKVTVIEDYGNGLRVHGLDLSANPASCASVSVAMPNRNFSEERKNRYNSLLLSAFYAGDKVQIKLSDAGCLEGKPTYYAVKVVK